MEPAQKIRVAQIIQEIKKTKDLVHLAWREEVVWQAKHRKVVAKEEILMNLLNRLQNDFDKLLNNEEYNSQNLILRKEFVSLLREQVLLIKKQIGDVRTLLHALSEAHNADILYNQHEEIDFVKLGEVLTNIKKMEDHLIQLV